MSSKKYHRLLFLHKEETVGILNPMETGCLIKSNKKEALRKISGF